MTADARLPDHAPAPAADEAPAFELLGELPRGRTVLEASAGTGKTFAIAALVTRYVVEDDVRLPELLVVTFTRAATAELRDRVRSRLVQAADHLEAVLAGAEAAHDDELLAHLAGGREGSPPIDPAELARRRDRAARAVADFDAATVATIHGFCQQVLRTLGLTIDADPDAELISDQNELVTAVVDDLLVQAATHRQLTGITRTQLLDIARAVVANPDARLVPDPDDLAAAGEQARAEDPGAEQDEAAPDPLPALRTELARRLRAELARRKRERRVQSYDDLLTQLRDALADPAQGETAAAALRSRYRIALIDEFQDTDPVQWDILARAFRGPQATLVLIGDPKQAIYSFRGADVHAYLDAVAGADATWTLPTNWRSDGPLLDALDTLLTGATFGDPRIAYRTVEPAPGHERPRLTGARAPAPLELRCLPRSHGLRADNRGHVNAGAARDHIAADLAAHTVRLLGDELSVRDRGGQRPLHAGDVAVLVRTNAEAAQVHRALRDAHVPAIINGVGSVFETPAATAWRRLLEALEQPSNPSRARALALSSFLGWRGEEIAEADDEALAPLHEQLHGWAEVLRTRGVASLLRTITVTQRLPERLLAVVGGERELTDLEHVGTLLHAAARAEQLGPSALTSWLAQAIADTDDEQVPPEERARRLESDARAVQILTVHRSKGLQYPVVLAPYLWSPGNLHPPVLAFHEEGRRVLDVGGTRKDEPTWEAHKERADAEHAGELLRLLYVALTRAEHHVTIWWSPCQNAGRSGLGRVLFARDVDGGLDTTRAGGVASDERSAQRLEALAERAGGTIEVAFTDRDPRPGSHRPAADPAPALDRARLERDVDRAWHRTSYSRLTRDDEEPLVASEPEDGVTDDEELDGAAADAAGGGQVDLDEALLREVPLPLGDLGAGPELGTFVHAVLEHTDLAADDLEAELARAVAEQMTHRPVAVDADRLVPGLARVIETPLGPAAGGLRLADLGRADRLDELVFELPLDPRLTGGATVAALGRLLEAHTPTVHPLAGYGRLLRTPRFHTTLRGFLTGSIDLVLRAPGADGEPRYLVADHKTNRLARRDEPLTAWHYRPAALADAMVRGHYPLQALLYQVALHRYLRWRQPGYDPDRHLGGVLYLFLRGMVGATTPTVAGQSCGVFTWQPPAELVVAASDLLDGGDR